MSFAYSLQLANLKKSHKSFAELPLKGPNKYFNNNIILWQSDSINQSQLNHLVFKFGSYFEGLKFSNSLRRKILNCNCVM